MKIRHLLSPFDVSKTFRYYLYDNVVLAWETDQIAIVTGNFSKRVLNSSLGLRVEKIKKVSDVDLRSGSPWGPDEFLVHGEGGGYEPLFKRLRDTFAHGHFGSERRGWITMCHRYKGGNEKHETTRLYARLKQSTLKQLVSYLDLSNSLERGNADD